MATTFLKGDKIGIRMALGAERFHVMNIFLKHATVMGVIGILAGLVLSGFASRIGERSLGASALQPVLLAAVSASASDNSRGFADSSQPRRANRSSTGVTRRLAATQRNSQEQCSKIIDMNSPRGLTYELLI